MLAILFCVWINTTHELLYRAGPCQIHAQLDGVKCDSKQCSIRRCWILSWSGHCSAWSPWGEKKLTYLILLHVHCCIDRSITELWKFPSSAGHTHSLLLCPTLSFCDWISVMATSRLFVVNLVNRIKCGPRALSGLRFSSQLGASSLEAVGSVLPCGTCNHFLCD